MKPSTETVKTVGGSVQLAVQYFANAVLGLIFFIFLARMITKVEMGVFAALFFSYGLFMAIGGLGLSVAAAHFVPKFLGEGKQESASGAAKTIILVAFLSSSILSVTYFISAPFLSFILTKTYVHSDIFRMTSLVVLSVSFSTIMEGLMQGIREFSRLAIIRLLSQIARILVSLVLLLAGYGLFAVVIGWVIFGACISLMSLPSILKYVSLRGSFYPFRPIWHYSFPILGWGILNIVSGQIDIFLLMLYVLPAQVGGYNIALTSSSLLVTLVVASVYSTLLPTMSRSFGKDGIKAVESAFKKTSRLMAFTYFPACIGLASLSSPTIWLMAGKVYQESILPLTIIASSSMAYGMAILTVIALTSIGETKRAFEINAISTIGSACSLVFLIPILGINGAAIGRSLLFILMLIYGIHAARKSMIIGFDSDAILKSISSSILMAFVLVIFQIFYTSIFLLPIYVFVGILTYAASLKVFNAIHDYDLMILKGVLPKRLEFIIKFATKFYT